MKKYILLAFLSIFILLGNGITFADGFVGHCPQGQTPGQNGCTSSSNSDKSSVSGGDNILGVDSSSLRSGDVNLDTIPAVIVSLIKIVIGIAGTVAIVGLIYNAVKMQLKSGITGDSSGVDSAKKGMIASLVGFVIAILAWFIVTRAVELMGSIR